MGALQALDFNNYCTQMFIDIELLVINEKDYQTMHGTIFSQNKILRGFYIISFNNNYL